MWPDANKTLRQKARRQNNPKRYTLKYIKIILIKNLISVAQNLELQ